MTSIPITLHLNIPLHVATSRLLGKLVNDEARSLVREIRPWIETKNLYVPTLGLTVCVLHFLQSQDRAHQVTLKYPETGVWDFVAICNTDKSDKNAKPPWNLKSYNNERSCDLWTDCLSCLAYLADRIGSKKPMSIIQNIPPLGPNSEIALPPFPTEKTDDSFFSQLSPFARSRWVAEMKNARGKTWEESKSAPLMMPPKIRGTPQVSY